MTKKRYWIKTFGCQMNQADSERLALSLEKRGYQRAKTRDEAELIIINSCVVRQSAENRVYGLIRNLLASSLLTKKSEIILTGCLAGWALRGKKQTNLSQLRKRVGPKVKIKLIEDLIEPELLTDLGCLQLEDDASADWGKVPIAQGCNQLCSYCIVPYARGPEVYRSAKEILAEVKCFLDRGYQKILLLGQNVNSWQGSGKIKTFPQLLASVATLARVQEVNFLSANPWDFSDQLIDVIANHHNISRTIHLPVQSGDDNILKRMRRPYTAADYLALVKRIRKKIPGVKLTTDIIVGFPGEDQAAFEKTVALCRQVGFERAFIGKYSPRPGTIAAQLYQDDVSAQEKKRRWWILEKLINQKNS